MHMKKFIALFYCSLMVFVMTSCGSSKVSVPVSPKMVNLALVSVPQTNKYVNLEYGIRLNVKDGRENPKILQKYDASPIYVPSVSSDPEIKSFVSESMRRYMRTMGFNLDADVSTDYMMQVRIDNYVVNWLSGIGWSATVKMSIEVYDNNRKLVYPNTVVTGRANKNVSASNFTAASEVLNAAYANALEDVDWDRIAFFLDKADSPALEGNKQVTGEGNTALESTVIRWYVESNPKGADIYWRVVSSTPAVKNTNQTFLGSTPYESTETFDIKGLTYNNSGNVQIEISCEKNGYITQKKRFNLRQVIDQKEISTKMNLIKDE